MELSSLSDICAKIILIQAHMITDNGQFVIQLSFSNSWTRIIIYLVLPNIPSFHNCSITGRSSSGKPMLSKTLS